MSERPARRPSIKTGDGLVPLSSINTYSSGWVIKARVTNRTPLTSFTAKRTNSPGGVFSCTLVDKEGTQINAKFWNTAADKYDPIIEKGKVYRICNGRVGVANKRYANGVDHNYELSFDVQNPGEVTPVEDDDDMPTGGKIMYSTLRSVDMSAKRPPFTANLLGVVYSCAPSREVTTKAGDNTSVRNIVIVDATEYSLEVAMWGQAAESDVKTGDVIGFAALQIREGKTGKVGQTLRATGIEINPDTEASKSLRDWFTQSGSACDYNSLGSTRDATSAAVVKECNLREMTAALENGIPAEGLSFKVEAYVTQIISSNRDGESNLIYKACPSCNRKVDSDVCTCGNTNPSVPRLSALLHLSDDSLSNVPVRAFNECMQELFGASSVTLAKQLSENPAVAETLCEYTGLWESLVFVVRARSQMYNGEMRTRLSINSASRRTPSVSASFLSSEILKLLPNAFSEATNKRGNTSQNAGEECTTSKRLRVEESN